jgi:hypothetical protein
LYASATTSEPPEESGYWVFHSSRFEEIFESPAPAPFVTP